MAAATQEKAPAAKKAYKRNPEYLVWRVAGDGSLVPLNQEPIAAASRKEAIIKATASEQTKDGEYVVAPAKQVARIKRSTETQTVEKFS
jgi:hypothetical protein